MDFDPNSDESMKRQRQKTRTKEKSSNKENLVGPFVDHDTAMLLLK